MPQSFIRDAEVDLFSMIRPQPQSKTGHDHGLSYEPAALTLDERGMIRDCNGSGEVLFGYRRNELVWRHVSILLPQLSGTPLLRDGEVDPQLDFLCHCGKLFALHNRLGNILPSELSLVQLENAGRHVLRLMVRPIDNSGL